MSRPVWIDIENPPQVQYLAPFLQAFEQLGVPVSVTARDYGITLELLAERQIAHRLVGRHFGKGKARKAAGVLGRSARLVAHARSTRPRAVLSASRSAAVASRVLGIPSYVIIDYEHVELGVFRRAGSTILFPEVIGAAAFERQGFARERLVPFSGIKEDLTFAWTDLDGVEPHRFDADERLVRVLLRPPAEESHYYVAESGRVARRLLDRLAAREDAVVVFSPRYPWQVEQLAGRTWANEPIVLERPVPFLALLKSVDAVISSGGTMLRESAYLGVPAYSIFQGTIGAVDRHLESDGRMVIVRTEEDLDRLVLAKNERGVSVRPNSDVVLGLARTLAG